MKFKIVMCADDKYHTETTYTLIQIRDAIVKAYQMYDNDSQRLAYLSGYFAK